MKNRKNRIVIVGRNYCNLLAMTRAFGKAGYKCDILRLYKKKPSPLRPMAALHPESESMYTASYHTFIMDGREEDFSGELLKLGNTLTRPLLVAVDDYSLDLLDSRYEELKNDFILSSVNESEGEISRMMDKNMMKEKALQAGLPVLGSRLVTSSEGKYTLPSGITYPCFIKPNVSKNSTKGIMRKCDGEEELRAALDRYAAKDDFQILVEDFADIKCEYSVLGYSTGTESISPGIFRVTSGGHRERKGVAVTGTIEDRNAYSTIIEQCNAFITSLNYKGLFDVDLLETKDGKLYFIELNFRAGASIHLFTETGKNIPAMYASEVLEQEKTPVAEETCKMGFSFISEKVLIEEYVRSDIDKKKALQLYNDADVHFIHDAVDSRPYEYFKRVRIIGPLMRAAYKIKDAIR